MPLRNDEVTTPLIRHTMTMLTDLEMVAINLANNLILEDDETGQSRCPKLCINGVEVDLAAREDLEYRNTTAVQSWVKKVAPAILEPVVVATPAAVEGYIPSIFSQRPITPPPTPPPSPGAATLSITPAVAVGRTAPYEAQGLIAPIFGSEFLSKYGMFYLSTIPCKREGSPLEKLQDEQ
jgi:hypothetical protein